VSKKYLRIKHVESDELIADGPLGWGITPFEGNYYIGRKYLRTNGFRSNYIPGLCPYKFLYVWLDFTAADGLIVRKLGWKYWLPNPLLPFIWFRVAVPGQHSELSFEVYEIKTMAGAVTPADETSA